MRVKTEDRRQAIIEVAIEVFREVGLQRASMDMISRRLGGSKGTLYGYFLSKEELFETAMRAAVGGPGDQIMGLLEPEAKELRTVLERFGRAYLNFVIGEEVLAITRTAVSEGAYSPLGAHLFDQGPGRAIAALQKYFASQIERGQFRPAPPLTMSLHFKSLLEAGFLEEALYGASFPVGRREAIVAAVDTFLRAYGPANTAEARVRPAVAPTES